MGNFNDAVRTITQLVHVAGQCDETGTQRCNRCHVVLTEPGLSPFIEGDRVEVTTIAGTRAKTSVVTSQWPTCALGVPVHLS